MTRLVTLVSIAVLAGCPGPKPENTGPGGGTGGGTGADAKDDELAYAPLERKGTYFNPEGLDRPNMLLAAAPKKTTLDKQRAAYKKAKPEAKADEALVLATLLYQASQKETDEARRRALAIGQPSDAMTPAVLVDLAGRFLAMREPAHSNCVATGSKYMLSLRPACTASDVQVVGCGSATTSSSSDLSAFIDSGMRVILLLA